MALLKTSNPALSGDAFRVGDALVGDTMTISGTINKTGILLICVVATAAWSWNLFTTSPQNALPLLAVGGIGGFIVAFVTIFKKTWSPVTAPMYALLEGLVLGSASAMLEIRFPGIAMQAVGLTFGTLVALLLAYRSGIIRATEKFKIGIVGDIQFGENENDRNRFIFVRRNWVHGQFGKPKSGKERRVDLSRQLREDLRRADSLSRVRTKRGEGAFCRRYT
jgi:Bax inhibitor 1 like